MTMKTLRAGNNNDDRRTTPGEGENVWIYVMGTAQDYADSIVPAFGEISAGCGPNLREDFAKCIWPVTIKVKVDVSDQQLIQHLRDLAGVIESNLGRRETANRETTNVIPFDRDQKHGTLTTGLRDSMRRHWKAGLRTPEFYHAVRGDCPTATLEEFNAAADAVWSELGLGGGETAP